MMSLTTLLSLAVLIGVATCMSLQEYEDDEANRGPLGWGIHFHFHFLEDQPELESKDNVKCTKTECKLCAEHNFTLSSDAGDKEKMQVAYHFDGCVNVALVDKSKDAYSVEFQGREGKGQKHFYKNTYERFNGNNLLPCYHRTSKAAKADLCPMLYDVDQKAGKMCIKILERFESKSTKVEHTFDLGCTAFE